MESELDEDGPILDPRISITLTSAGQLTLRLKADGGIGAANRAAAVAWAMEVRRSFTPESNVQGIATTILQLIGDYRRSQCKPPEPEPEPKQPVAGPYTDPNGSAKKWQA